MSSFRQKRKRRDGRLKTNPQKAGFFIENP